MRERILGAALELLQLEGVRGLSMRAVSAHASVSLGAIQFHFGNQRSFVREVFRWWGARVTRSLDASGRERLGLARTWCLCQCWVALPDAGLIAVVASGPPAPSEERDVGRATLLELMDEWIEETVRSLRQAQHRGELKQEVDPRVAALDLHRLLWSHSWSSRLFGFDASAGAVLAAAWRQLSLIAAGEEHLPPRPSPRVAPSRVEPPPDFEPEDLPLWVSLLERGDPLFHAFLRHEIMDDPRSFLHPPKVLPEDEREAERYRARHGGGAGSQVAS
jgi:AcrR family transcriptional regulator